MRTFLAKHDAAIAGTLSCFDRVLFKGHLALGYDRAMTDLLQQRGILFKDFKPFVVQQAERLKAHAAAMAEQAGRPCDYLEAPVRKDQRARAVAERDGVTTGLRRHVPCHEPAGGRRSRGGRGPSAGWR